MKALPNGSTDVTTYFVLRDSTTHAPKTDVTVTAIDLYYQEQGAAQAAKVDATALAAADSAHSDNCAYHCGNGVYRIDWPDAAFDGGIGKTVILIVVCTGVDTCYREIILSPQVDVHSLSGDSTAADNCELMFDGTGYAGGTTKLGIDVVNWKGDAAPAMTGDAYARLGAPAGASVSADVAAVKSDTASILTDTAEIGAAGAGLSAVPWNAAWDAEVQSEAADALAAYDPPTKAELDSGFAALNDFDPAADTVAHVTLVDTTTTNTDMVAAAPSAASVADAVWDEAIAGHADVGSTGAALAAAGGSGDPWATALPGAYGAGTAGKILGDNLNAPVGTVDTVVDGIATTLGAAGAGLTAVPWNAAWDAEVQSEATDALNAYDPPTKAELDAGFAGLNDVSAVEVGLEVDASLATYDGPTKAELDSAVAGLATAASLATVAGYVDTEVASVKAVTDKIDTALELDVDVYRFTTNALEMSPAGDGGGATAEAIRIEMDSNSTRLASIDGKLASTTVTVQSPVASSGAITVHTGDDYDATHGRALEVTVDDVPDLTDATVKLKCSEATWTGSVAAGGGTAWVISFEPTAAETALLTKRTQAYEIEAELSDGDVVTLATGTLSAVRDIPEVV